jgi:RNA polymerase sigma factor (sigma-70 family)
MFIEEFFPNYHKLYPNVKISEELYKALRQSDQKIKYMEYDLKHGKATYVNSVTGKPTNKDDPFAEIEGITPSREISLDMLFAMGEKAAIFIVNPYDNPEKIYLKKERIAELYRCISLLKQEEKLLLFALFWDELTEAEYAEIIEKHQSTVNRMKKKILDKIRESFDW